MKLERRLINKQDKSSKSKHRATNYKVGYFGQQKHKYYYSKLFILLIKPHLGIHMDPLIMYDLHPQPLKVNFLLPKWIFLDCSVFIEQERSSSTLWLQELLALPP